MPCRLMIVITGKPGGNVSMGIASGSTPNVQIVEYPTYSQAVDAREFINRAGGGPHGEYAIHARFIDDPTNIVPCDEDAE